MVMISTFTGRTGVAAARCAKAESAGPETLAQLASTIAIARQEMRIRVRRVRTDHLSWFVLEMGYRIGGFQV